jgi:hypothetical protein
MFISIIIPRENFSAKKVLIAVFKPFKVGQKRNVTNPSKRIYLNNICYALKLCTRHIFLDAYNKTMNLRAGNTDVIWSAVVLNYVNHYKPTLSVFTK